MGTSIGVLEQLYSKMTDTMTADRLARMGNDPDGFFDWRKGGYGASE